MVRDRDDSILIPTTRQTEICSALKTLRITKDCRGIIFRFQLRRNWTGFRIFASSNITLRTLRAGGFTPSGWARTLDFTPTLTPIMDGLRETSGARFDWLLIRVC